MPKNQKKSVKIGDALLIPDVLPKNIKEIIALAGVYKKSVNARMALGKKEVEQKHELIELVRAAKLKTTDKGVIMFSHEDITITLTPGKDTIKVKEELPE